MKLLFVHDFPAEKYSKKNEYYSTGFPYIIWKRYLKVFDKLLISSRYKEINNIESKSLSSVTNVKFYPVKSYNSPLSLIKNRKKILREINEAIDQVDAVLIRVPSVLGFLAAKICIDANKPYMVEVVGSAFEAYRYHGSVSGKILAIPMEISQKIVVRNAKLAIYVTKSYLQRKYPTKGERFDGISDVVKMKMTKSDFTKSNDKIIKIGLIGSTYTRYKGHKEALMALSILKKQGFEIQLQIVGQGLSRDVKKYITRFNLNEDVIHLGVIYDKEKLSEWFSEIDIYIQPSMTEGLCRSLIESVYLNKITFASNVGGNSDIISKPFLFKQKDYKKLAKLIKRSIEEPEFNKLNLIENKMLIKNLKLDTVEERRIEALNKFKTIVKEGWNS
ncbi:glycosyltransferase [Staphylococcus equorum]|uniref:glycosyltransferase n=1 Tax=Staphylococcus equorum TaxID=246432 RepID=UPI002DBB0EC0|nr:glycosyltransferase [Staphylococcus equorum]MEB7673058.1 glycosyltransferase [Staphylococcus equorum]